MQPLLGNRLIVRYIPPRTERVSVHSMSWASGTHVLSSSDCQALLSPPLLCPLPSPLYCILRPEAFSKGEIQRDGGTLVGKSPPSLCCVYLLSCRAQPFMASSATPTPKVWTDLRSDDIRTSRANFPSALSPLAFTCVCPAFSAWPHRNHRSSPLYSCIGALCRLSHVTSQPPGKSVLSPVSYR